MKNLRRVGAVVALTGAMVLSLGATAFAGSASTSSDISWTIPTTAMTNTVEKDGVTYKVITTSTGGWAISGMDYLGVSNDTLVAGGGGGDNSLSTLAGAQSGLIGIWATAANESPNAYNWNAFYNLYANSDEGIAAEAEVTELTVVTNSWDATSGVHGYFKYRPELVIYNNNLKESAAAEYIGYIQNGQYYTSTPSSDSETADKSEYYIEGDENYDPYTMWNNPANPYTWVQSLYCQASLCEQIIADTADYTGTATDWKGMNTLPRSTRYEKSAAECALSVEKIVRGSVYYVLSQINAGTVEKKKVAILGNSFSSTSDTVTVYAFDYIDWIGQGITGGAIGVAPLVVDQLMTGTDVQEVKAQGSSTTGGGAGTNSATTGSDLYYTSSTATADQLLECDYILCTNAGTTSAAMEAWLEANATSADKTTKIANISILATNPGLVQSSNYVVEKLIWSAWNINFFYPELFENMELVAYWFDQVYHIQTELVGTVMSYTCGGADLPADANFTDVASTYSLDAIEAKFAEGYAYYIANSTTDPTISRILNGEPVNIVEGSTVKASSGLAFNAFEPSDTYAEWYLDYAYGVSSDDITEIIDTLTELTETNEAQAEKITELTEAAEELQASYDTAVSELTEAKTSITTLESNVSSLEEQIAALQEQLAELTAADIEQTISAAKKSAKIKKGKTVKIKISGASTTIKASCSKAGVKVSVKNGKVVIKGAKKGTYTVKVYAAAGSGYAKSNVVKIKVTVK